jgi:DNA-binding IclR family transcriptional regulator
MSVRRVVGLLSALAHPEAPLSLSRLSTLLGAPKPSLLSLLNELVGLQYVRRTEHGFELGSLAYRLGLQIVAVDSLSAAVRAVLIEVNAKLGMTAAFGYLDRSNRSLIYADRYEAAGPVRYVVSLGTPLAIHSRALGRLLVSYEPETDWPSWFGTEPYERYTRNTTTRFSDLRPLLLKIRDEGIVTTIGEQHEGIGSCAVPVLGFDSQVACGIATQTLGASLEERKAEVAAVLKDAANVLSKELAARRIVRDTLSQHI